MGIPVNIALAVAEKEDGKPGERVRNGDGSYDVGPQQFNTRHLAQLVWYGITEADVAGPGCYPYDLAAWRLRRHIVLDESDLWTRCANYHSRTPRFNKIYRDNLMMQAVRWADWLATRYPTHEVAGHGRRMLRTWAGKTRPAVTRIYRRCYAGRGQGRPPHSKCCARCSSTGHHSYDGGRT